MYFFFSFKNVTTSRYSFATRFEQTTTTSEPCGPLNICTRPAHAPPSNNSSRASSGRAFTKEPRIFAATDESICLRPPKAALTCSMRASSSLPLLPVVASQNRWPMSAPRSSFRSARASQRP